MGFKGINTINKILNEFLEEFEATADRFLLLEW